MLRGILQQQAAVVQIAHTSQPMLKVITRCSRLKCSVRTEKQKCFLCMLGINYVRSHKLDATVEQPVNGEGREKQWSEVMCNLTTQWAVPSNGPLNAGSVREINS